MSDVRSSEKGEKEEEKDMGKEAGKKEKRKETFFYLHSKEKMAQLRGSRLWRSGKGEELDPEIKDESPVAVDPEQTGEHQTLSLKDLQVSDAKQCSYCRVEFLNIQEQRGHYKLDWHRYNLKLSLESRAAVSEEEFSSILEKAETEDGNISISGSDSEDEDDEDEYTLASRDPRFYLKTSSGNIVSIFKTLIVVPKSRDLPSESALQTALDRLVGVNTWAIFMLGGGHFAGAVFRDNQVLVHKTFHCYTVRAKQGGSQGSADNKAGSTHKSAGASLRRYNEMALIQHVQDITKLWSAELASCSLIFCRAASSNRNVLFGGKQPALARNDPRLRSIPFPTKRATFSEVKRVQDLLSRVEIHQEADLFHASRPTNKVKEGRIRRSKSRDLPARIIPGIGNDAVESDPEDENESELNLEVEIQDTRHLAEFDQSNAKKKKKKKTSVGLTEKEDSENGASGRSIALQNRFLTAVRSGNMRDLNECVEQLLSEVPEEPGASMAPGDLNDKTESVINKEKDMTVIEDIVNRQFGEGKLTFLHLAAQAGHRSIVGRLLELGSDPCVRDKLKRVPYTLAQDKETRNIFRKFQGNFPNRYDWKGAQVPPPLTQQEEEEKERKQSEKKKAKRLEKKEKDKLVKEEDRLKKEQEKEKERYLKSMFRKRKDT
ncbi:ankyrin repeat and zinc finger domain-containing protein 1 isoform X2 [Eurytemora carolleeae]|uniref:ankyrin repeat and zinc finger domain-containing protein 1 isoform X2 n=1 Tax=Eurytemora carolleeae TaxID=1294199 RepID=UPI000C768AC8|nr:ankyrin repeat and zinc finger domain-containing protein 1 isoform X2 [Eurytemora carolleeae]|eukprot:XP_023329835.1 ankyrin repeat and zinc finger domain-containing protein 1-like isoform X2 [Eurytemora affinis]